MYAPYHKKKRFREILMSKGSIRASFHFGVEDAEGRGSGKQSCRVHSQTGMKRWVLHSHSLQPPSVLFLWPGMQQPALARARRINPAAVNGALRMMRLHNSMS
jgi:hypothetical protein